MVFNGHGMEPDIPIDEDPGQLSKGIDSQLERAIQEVMDGLNMDFEKPERPPYQNRWKQ